jgi:hypothetical protein
VPVPKTSPITAARDFYGAIIRQATLGPRRELVLRIEAWPQFFATVPMDSLHYLRYSSKSSPRRNVIEMEFDRSEARITIVAGNVARYDK